LIPNSKGEHVSANPIHQNVKDAPFRIGELVRVLSSEDDTFDPTYRGRVGIVKYLEYECGCGQSFPLDPMIGIEFDNMAVEEFWREELGRYPAPASNSCHDQRSR
jgi:hypothetical protein